MSNTGRLPRLSPEQVLDYLQLPIPAQAEHLGVSIATVKRRWKLLREQASSMSETGVDLVGGMLAAHGTRLRGAAS